MITFCLVAVLEKTKVTLWFRSNHAFSASNIRSPSPYQCWQAEESFQASAARREEKTVIHGCNSSGSTIRVKETG